jgi:hypothetical protein
MSIGNSRQLTFADELAGQGAYYTATFDAPAAGATSVKIVGNGGSAYGAPQIKVGMTIFFLAQGKLENRAITAIGADDGNGNFPLTVAALTFSHVAGEDVGVGYPANKPMLVQAFKSSNKFNKWSTNDFNGGRAKNTTRRKGHYEVDGSLEFMLRPDTDNALLTKGIGKDGGNVRGTINGTPITGTFSVASLVGDTTFTSTTGTWAINDMINIDRATYNTATPISEVRKITAKSGAGPYVYTVDSALNYAHTSTATVDKLVAHTATTIYERIVHSSQNNLPSVAFEDWVPLDDETLSTGVTDESYYISGAVFKGVKLDSKTDQGVHATLDYDAQGKELIAKSATVALPSESVYDFTNEIVLFDGVRDYNITEIDVNIGNDTLKRWTKNGTPRPRKIAAGQQEVTGTYRFLEDAQTQQKFWYKVKNDTPVQMTWKTIDKATSFYISVICEKVVLDELNDEDFSPADLVDCEIPWVAINDTGNTNEQVRLEMGNNRYLPYTA